MIMEKKKRTVAEPVTKGMLIAALKKIGVSGNQIIEVHSSLSSFDYIVGGAHTVVDALLEICGDGGTILMPTQNIDNSEPSDWQYPGIEPYLYKKIRSAIPPYDRRHGNIRYMGEVPENFRHREGVVISSHPAVSYAAWGRYAKLLCNRQSVHFPLSEESPCARLYELKGSVLLLGTDFDTCTCMHLAEYRCDCRPVKICGASMSQDDKTVWKKYLDLDTNCESFMKVKAIMAKKNMIRETTVGGGHIMYFSASNAIDEATRYYERTVVYDLYR